METTQVTKVGIGPEPKGTLASETREILEMRRLIHAAKLLLDDALFYSYGSKQDHELARKCAREALHVIKHIGEE